MWCVGPEKVVRKPWQGNIAKAVTIASQARTQLALLEKTVEADVRRAVRQHESTLRAVERVKAETLSDEAMAIKPLMKRFEKGGPSPDLQMLMLLERLQRLISDDDDTQLAKLDELKIQHRRSMLKLNTTVGQRVLP
jgi:hypothetical protein